MKVSFVLKLFFCALFYLSLSSHTNAQWSPQNADLTVPNNREGAVGIGMENNPLAILHVSQRIQGQSDYPPTFRLERFTTLGSGGMTTSRWDITPSNDGLQFFGGDILGSYHAMNITQTGLEVAGSKLQLGYGGTTSSDDMTIAYSNIVNGNYLAFNGTYQATNGSWKGPSGKTVIHSNVDGTLYFSTESQGNYIPLGQKNRLTITPEGTSIFGDIEARQTLSISSGGRSILRFNRDGENGDWELLGNQDGHLEFRGGIDGEGTELPTLMRLKPTGKLAIGTVDSPDWVGGVDISNYKLYVEGGILTKEIRVRTTWSDYVFEKDYNLLPLERVESYIKENGHLHYTPSGKSIEENGLELGSMMANQQEKIEEVYLHLIEMNKKLANLEKENEALKEQVKDLKK